MMKKCFYKRCDGEVYKRDACEQHWNQNIKTIPTATPQTAPPRISSPKRSVANELRTLYVIGPVAGGGPYKLGIARDIEHRLCTLQTGCWLKLGVVDSAPGTVVDERWLHQKFDFQRMEGEWFDLSAENLLELEVLMGLKRTELH